MEIWDGYLKDGTPANQDLVRGEPIPNGLYHLVSEILIRHTDGDYLLMKGIHGNLITVAITKRSRILRIWHENLRISIK